MNTTALLKLLLDKTRFQNITSYIKNNKGKTAIGGGVLGLGILKSREDEPIENKQQTQEQTTKPKEQSSEPKKQSTNPKQKKIATKHSQKPVLGSLPPLDQVLNSINNSGVYSNGNNSLPPPLPTNNVNSDTNEVDSFKDLQKQFLSLFAELDKYRQEYDLAIEKHMQANELYEKQLLSIMPTISLLLSKTPLNNMTNEDLIHHTTQLFTSMPYSDALENFSKLTKGYYLAKMNNVNPSELSTSDLIAIADNPVLAKATADENIANYLDQVGEILKLKIKSNLDEVGALKDAFSNYKKELEEKAKIIKDLIDLKKVETMLNINQFKAEVQAEHLQRSDAIKERHNKAMEDLGKQRIKLQEEKFNWQKQNKQKQDNNSLF
jgi:hypothetical protein